MTSYSELLQEWRRHNWRPIHESPILTDDGLLLGAATRLTTFERDHNGVRNLVIDGRKKHILSLLSVAYWRPISPDVLGYIRRAEDAYRRGEVVLANIHLALSGLPRLEDASQAACRLFMADRLLAQGLKPIDLLKGLDIDVTPLYLLKASSDDPKHPGWPAGTEGGLGGKFRPKDGDPSDLGLLVPVPIADFSGGFHGVVIDTWMKFFDEKGVPAVKAPAIRFVGPNNSVVGYPDMIADIPGEGLTVIEVKTGVNPTLTPNQAIYLPVIEVGAHIYSDDPRISQLGLTPGVPFPPIPVILLYAPGPGLPYQSERLPPLQFLP